MIEKLKLLKTLLGNNCVIVTGSIALAYHGLLEFGEAKDIDLRIVQLDSYGTTVLDNLQKANPSPKFREGGPVSYSFIFEGVKFDIFKRDNHEDHEYLVTKDGIKVASIRSIVAAKLSYNRSKDWIQLLKLSRTIYNPLAFETQLPYIVTTDDYLSETDAVKTTPRSK